MISAKTLAASRAQMEKMLTDTCDHYAKSDTVNDDYATSSGYVSQGELPCLIYADSVSARSEFGNIGEATAEVGLYIIRLPWDASVRVGDKLVTSDDSEFLVVSDGDSDTNRFLLQVGAQRIRGSK